MAHFAKTEDDIVVQVHVVHNDVLKDGDGVEREQLGIDFLVGLHGGGTWVQTSYNRNFRGRFAGKGYRYDKVLDIFVPPQSYDSWILNEVTGDWEAPKEIPEHTPSPDFHYAWNESKLEWEKMIHSE